MGLILPAAVATAVLYVLYHYLLYPAFLSPLRNLPAAHWTCHFSSLWVLLARKNRRENKSLHEAHLRHGPVVRVGPAEVSVDGVEAVRTVYQGGFEKGRWYSIFDNYGIPNMFSTASSKPHSLRKRMISNVYSKSFIQSSAASRSQTAHILFQRMLPVLYKPSRQKSAVDSETDRIMHHNDRPDTSKAHDVEVFSLFLATAMDMIIAYVFGLSNGTNFIRDESYRQSWQEMYLARANYTFWPQEVPGLTTFCKRWVPWFRLYPGWVDESNAELGRWNTSLCEGIQKAMDRKAAEGEREAKNTETTVANEPVVYSALNAGIDSEFRTNGEKSMLYSTSILKRDTAVASELMDHSLAGQETAGIALTYATWHLSKMPAAQEELRAEIQSLGPSLRRSSAASSGAEEEASGDTETRHDLPDPKAVDSLPLLNAIIMETLRLHAPIPGPQPRETPKDGCSIAGYRIPGGVRIASLAYTLHRDEEVFPKPEEWNPRRWLAKQDKKEGQATSAEEEERRREMHRRFWAFGSGGRMCIGSNFAMNEMKYILAVIYANFRTTVVDDEAIEQEDAYTARPLGEHLVLRFEPLEDEAGR
ncbi:hypothetical protein ACJ41O_001524 [Fusarium nematophilum]